MAARHDLRSQIGANRRRTIYLMAGFTIFVAGVAAVFDLVLAGGPIVLAVAIVIAVTTGLLSVMNRAELEGVLAHELSHIHNYDILVGTLVGFVALLADFGLRLLLFGGIAGRRRDSRDAGQVYLFALSVVFIVLAPIAAKAMQLAISRRREALADVSGVLITRNPAGLIAALEKLRDRPSVVAHAPAATAHLWIQSPLDHRSPGAHGWFNRLFETHPPIEQRIAALREIEGAGPLLPSA
jgi:heat shock protein HtpX